jgi:hypothetical protein
MAVHSVKRPLQFGTLAPCFHSKYEGGDPSLSLREDLKDWLPSSPGDDAYDPVESDFKQGTRSNNEAFNLEMLKLGLDAFEARALGDREKSSDELKAFRSQLHDLKIYLGSDPRF